MSEDAVTADGDAAESKKPFLTVVSGNPTDEDVAVLVGVLAAAGGSSGPAEPEIRNDWGRPTDMHRPSWGMPTSFLHRG